MSGDTVSARLGLPYLVAGQAQKEVTHNEALALIDAAIAPAVVAVGTTVAPTAPVIGDCWIVGSGASGAWLGQAGSLALYTAGGWRFVALPIGSTVVDRGNGARWLHTSTGWQAPVSILPATGGATIDIEVRTALTALLNALSARGIIAPAGS